MAQPGTPLDTLWLAPRVFLLVKKHMDVEGVWCSRNEALQVRKTRLALLDLLGFLEPHVLRSDPVTFKWLVRTLQSVPKMRLTASGGVIKVETPLNGHGSETMWNAGLAAWNERCEAQRLQLRSSGAEGHDVTLEAIVDNRFADVLSAAAGQMLSSCSQIRPLMICSWAIACGCLLPGAMARGGRSRATKSTTRSTTTAQWAEYEPHPPAPQPAVHVDEPSDYRLLPLLLPLLQLLLVIQLAATAAALALDLAAAIFAALALAAATAAAQAFVDIALARTLARATGELTVAALLALALAADIFAALALAATAERALA